MDQYDYLTRDQLISLIHALGAGRDGGIGRAPGDADGLPEFSERARRDFESSSSPMRIFDHETLRYLAVNDAAVKFYGYSREEFLRLTLKDTRHPDEHAVQLASLKEAVGYLRHGKPRRHIKKSGEVAVAEVLTQDVLFDGRKARLSLTIDITERLRMQELLWKRQQEFESLADNLPDLVARFDRDRRYIYANSAVERTVGVSREQIIGRTQRELGMAEEIASLFDDSLAGVFASGEPHKVEFQLALPSGARRYEAYHVAEMENTAMGAIGSVLCVARDVTERWRNEIAALRSAELSRLLESLARAANEAVTPEAAMAACLERICAHGGWIIGRVEIFDRGRPGEALGRSIWRAPEDLNRFAEFIRSTDGHVHNVSGPFIGRVVREQTAVWIEDWQRAPGFHRWEAAASAGLRSAFAFPVIARGEVVAIMEVFSQEARPRDPQMMGAVQSLASQLARIVERERAHEANAKLAAIVESSQDAIVSRALDGTILTWNAGAERLLGYTAAEIVGRNLVVLYPPELKPKLFRRQELMLQGKATPSFETVRLAKDGRRVHVSLSSAPIRDSSGEAWGISTIMRDITDAKRVEQALRESNEFLRSIIESSRDCVKVLDLEGRLQMISSGGQSLMELDDVSSLLGKSYLDFWSGGERDVAGKALAAARAGETSRFEGYCPTSKGAPRWWDEIVTPILGRDGVPEKLLVVSRDVTQNRCADEALSESRERLAWVLDVTGIGTWMNQLPLERLNWDGRTRELFFLPSGAEPTIEWFWERLHPDDREPTRLAVEAALRDRTLYTMDHRVVDPGTGRIRWVRSAGKAIYDAAGAAIRFDGINYDITEEKQAESERLGHAVRQRDALVREVHHRIKNNLQGVVGLLRQKIRSNPGITRDIEETISQLQSVALVYGLQGARSDGLVSLSEMVEAICASAESLVGGHVDRSFERQSRPACVAGTEAVSIAVVLNELVFNALKHQRARAGSKRAQLVLRENDGGAEIRITNRGHLPAGLDYLAGHALGNGLGLVRTLLASPGGSIGFSNGRGRVEVTLKLAAPLLAGRQNWITRRRHDGGTGTKKAAATPAGRGRRPAGAGRAG